MNKKTFNFYKEHPKTCDPDDFWGQIKRTVNGVPVSQDQIEMIVDAVVAGLELNPDDTLLDLCCGNGALSTLLFKHCNGGLGVDFSEYLISVANKNFAAPPSEIYLLQDAVGFCESPVDPDTFSKMVCYGSFSYLDKDSAKNVLCLLKSNFPNLKRVFIGNCPDKALMTEFFGDREVEVGVEDDPESPIGVWRTKEEFVSLAKSCGWQATTHKMAGEYYAAHYRYDVVLACE